MIGRIIKFMLKVWLAMVVMIVSGIILALIIYSLSGCTATPTVTTGVTPIAVGDAN
jgi:hypothetical protein